MQDVSAPWTVDGLSLWQSEVAPEMRAAAARVVELDTSSGIRRGVSRGLTVLDAWRSEGPLPSFTPTTWLGAVRERYPQLPRRARSASVVDVDVDEARAHVLHKLLPAARFGEPLDGDEFAPTAAGDAACSARDDAFGRFWSALAPTWAPPTRLVLVTFGEANNENTEHEFSVVAGGSVVVVAVCSYAM
jgi:hypothetical protein